MERIKRGSGRKKRFSLKKLLFFILILGGVFGLIKSQTRVWNGRDKLVVAVNSTDEIVVSTFDPETSEITNIYIPGETQVSSSRQLGTFRIKNIWKLGKNEKVGGILLAETVTKNFKFPVSSWADEKGLAFSSADAADAIGAIFSPFDTNLGIGDRLALLIFSLKVKNTNRVEIKLAQTNYLKSAKLIDGEEGYLISGSSSQAVASIFADSEFSSKALRIVIKNETGETTDAVWVAQLLEVLGGKVSSIVKGETKSYNCEVLGDEKTIVRKVAAILGCKVGGSITEGNFNLEVKLGRGFAERF
ncbi:MAG: hypothetical protein UX19_C0006G0004 [Candidatus Woesebacteria bacterium GW2011_GWA1_45_8]|uniref:LytR/CpsA/Psr regulator C-terminal domain-containing protein n=1 Tax=Candidatus Woesebacteria bacterium GW2011_GWA1_45_8 TaxID=1618559 RepID=A0A0G1Q361_9BACT|nr:MAG: hypothetical protein UX19_C0006G0004 [Candidatus Woesebacteria bacterium GW2011_GWA1_45_8]